MADDWNAFPEAKSASKDDFSAFPEVKGTPVREAVSAGQEAGLKDRMTIGSMEPDALEAVKSAAWEAGDMALLNAPSFVTAAYQSYKNNTPLKEELAKQREYTEALARQHPIASKIGTGVGFVGGMALPLGPLAKVGTAAERLAAPLIGETAAKAAGMGAISGTASGTAGYLGSLDMGEALRDAAVGAGVGTALQPVIGRLANRFIKEPGMLDNAGNLTERGIAETKAATGLGDEDVSALNRYLAPIIKEKGFSPAAAKEAQFKEFGVEPTAGMTTGEAPAAAAEGVAGKRIQEAKDVLGQKAEELIGRPEEGKSAAQVLHEAYTARSGEGGKRFEELKAAPEEFGEGYRLVEKPPLDEETAKLYAYRPKMQFEKYSLPDLVMPEVEAALKARDIPTNWSAVDTYPATKDAIDYLSRTVLANNMPFGDKMTIKNVDAIRRQLNSKFSQAKGDDARALGAVVDGFLNSVQKGIDQQLYSGDREAVQNIRGAVGYWKQYVRDFFSTEGTGPKALKKVMDEMIDPSTKSIAPTLSEGAMLAANQAINRNILKPGEGLAFYESLKRAIGDNPEALNTLHASIRSAAMDTGGDITKLPKRIEQFLSPQNISLAKAAFGADANPAEAAKQISQLRRLGKVIDQINNTPMEAAKKQKSYMDAVKQWFPSVIGAGVGALHGVPAQILGALGAEALSKTAAGIGESRAAARELAGAPKAARPPVEEIPMGPLTGRAPFVRNVPGLYPDMNKPEEYEVPPLTIRPGRATGGRIAHPESIANSLVSMADKAKKTINNNTEVLLKTPDTHVAQALEIANRQIEG